MDNVIPLQVPEEEPSNLTPTMARAKVRELVKDSANVSLTTHVRKRMSERGVSRKQIDNCLAMGWVPDDPYVNMYGNWQFNVIQLTAGVRLEVGVAIDWPSGVIVLTAFEV